MGNNNNQQTISDEINHLLSQKDLNETKIQEIRNISLNKYLKDLYDQLKKASGQERAQIGKNINDLRSLINTIIDAKLTTFVANNEQNNNVVNYDILINSSNHSFGCISPITKVIDDVANFFKSLNFTIQSGEEITKVKYAFDNLNVPKFHPTRDTSETFYIANDITLRQQCTATSAIVMENNTDPEIRIMNYGYVYRNDDDDASHSHQFNQVDFIWIKKDLNIRNLKWLINGFIKFMFGTNIKSRYRLSNFPFTEPSFEVDCSCPFCNGIGCSTCKQTGWIELLGCGLFNKNVMNAANIPDKNGIAAGLGIDRIAMLKYGISDVRDLYTNDFRFMQQFKKGVK